MQNDEEERYFAKVDAEKRRQLRVELAKAARELEENQKVAEGVGGVDERLAGQIRALGFDGDSAQVFDLLPLVHVAWADGNVTRAERATIFKALEQRGFGPGTKPALLFASLLEERPNDAYLSRSLAILRDVLGRRGDNPDTLAELCVAVAKASGGLFGLAKPVNDDERDVLETIAATLGDAAVSAFRQRLS